MWIHHKNFKKRFNPIQHKNIANNIKFKIVHFQSKIKFNLYLNLEKSKRMMEMVAMNGLRPGVAWFYCIIFITAGNLPPVGVAEIHKTTMSR